MAGMLGTPPPGYSPASINRQTTPLLTMPGYQGGVAQGYNPLSRFGSSFSVPSSMFMPSSVPTSAPQQEQGFAAPSGPGYKMPMPALGPGNINNIAKTLGGAR